MTRYKQIRGIYSYSCKIVDLRQKCGKLFQLVHYTFTCVSLKPNINVSQEKKYEFSSETKISTSSKVNRTYTFKCVANIEQSHYNQHRTYTFKCVANIKRSHNNQHRTYTFKCVANIKQSHYNQRVQSCIKPRIIRPVKLAGKARMKCQFMPTYFSTQRQYSSPFTRALN